MWDRICCVLFFCITKSLICILEPLEAGVFAEPFDIFTYPWKVGLIATTQNEILVSILSWFSSTLKHQSDVLKADQTTCTALQKSKNCKFQTEGFGSTMRVV